MSKLRTHSQRREGHAHPSETVQRQSEEDEDGQVWTEKKWVSYEGNNAFLFRYGQKIKQTRTGGVAGSVGDQEAGEGKAGTGHTNVSFH